MMLAFAFIALGYPIMYWGANQLKHWDRSIQQTDAAPLALLFGVSTPEQLSKADMLPSHSVPFPYTAKQSSSGSAPSGPSSGTPGGAQLSPNFPGGTGSTIPTPPVGGTSI